jgi:hypothetical protein
MWKTITDLVSHLPQPLKAVMSLIFINYILFNALAFACYMAGFYRASFAIFLVAGFMTILFCYFTIWRLLNPIKLKPKIQDDRKAWEMEQNQNTSEHVR